MVNPQRKRTELLRSVDALRVPRHLVDRVVRAILEGLDTPRSLAAWMLFESGEHQQLAALEVQPETYLINTPLDQGRTDGLGCIHSKISLRDGLQFRDDYLATCLLSKFEELKVDVDPKQVAISKWFDVEDQMRSVNKDLTEAIGRIVSNSADYISNNATFVHIITRARDRIAQILGEFDPTEWFELSSWGPGTTLMLKGQDLGAETKYRREAGTTHKLLPVLEKLIPAFSPLWGEALAERGLNPQNWNRLSTVKKNALTDRVIAVEPGLNVFFQLGIGRMIGRRLLRHEGINLEDQSRNGLLCFYGSLSGELATVDFSSASDRISYRLVEFLLPDKWFRVLDLCRAPYCKVKTDGGEMLLELQKFSSMGNGFTFPLQSLIFFALAVSVIEEHNSVNPVEKRVGSEYVGVFGDDVVLPKAVYKTFVEVVHRVGFKVNPSKSFSEGYFRESCGTHYFCGLDVKPIYIKEGLDDVRSVYRLANAIRRLAHRRGLGRGCDARLRTAWLLLRGAVPKNIRFHIPDEYGDGGFVDNFDASVPEPFRPKPASGKHPGCEGWLVPHLIERPVTHFAKHVGVFIARLRFRPHGGTLEGEYLEDSSIDLVGFALNEKEAEHRILMSRNNCSLRDAVELDVKVGWIHDWFDLGPWI